MTWIKWTDKWEDLHQGAQIRVICIKEFVSGDPAHMGHPDTEVTFYPFHIYYGFYYGFLDDIIFHADDDLCMNIVNGKITIETSLEVAHEHFRVLEVKE